MSDAELNGHIELVEQCADYLDHETMDNGDPSGKLHDFICSIRAVVSALSSTREKYEQAVREVERERDHSKMLSENNGRLCREKAEVETFCAKVRGQYTDTLRERDELRAEVDRLTGIIGNDMRDIEALKTERDEATRIYKAREDEVSTLRGVLGHAFDVVNERRAEIQHARETTNMCRLQRAVDGYAKPPTTTERK